MVRVVNILANLIIPHFSSEPYIAYDPLVAGSSQLAVGNKSSYPIVSLHLKKILSE